MVLIKKLIGKINLLRSHPISVRFLALIVNIINTSHDINGY